MGAAHSRARPGAGPTAAAKLGSGGGKKENSNGESESGYFILCLKMGATRDRVKLVNATGPVLKLLTNILSR